MIRKCLPRRSFAKGFKDPRTMADSEVNCLMLHPIGWPNKGPALELSLAQEAIGLVHSLGWNPLDGPNRGKDKEEEPSEEEEESLTGGGRSAPKVFSKNDNRT